VLNGYHPYFDEAAGADLSGYENAITHMLSDFDVKTVVPGHGETGGRDVIVEFKQYLDDMKLATENADEEIQMREKYEDYLSSPINKSGFDLTLDFIRKSESLRN
jgi:hypothetical protein